MNPSLQLGRSAHQRILHRLTSPLGLALVIAAITGCNSRPNTYPIDGKVVWKSGDPAKELVGYVVSFESEHGLTSGSGAIQADGTFTIGTFDLADGALAGKHRIAITPPEPPLDAAPPPRLIAKRFGSFETSGLTTGVKSGRNSVVLEVEGRWTLKSWLSAHSMIRTREPDPRLFDWQVGSGPSRWWTPSEP
jgi:hypothetical protein